MILDLQYFFNKDGNPSLSDNYEEDMTKSSISSYSDDSSIVGSGKKGAKTSKSDDHDSSLAQITSDNEAGAVIVSHHSSDKSECYETEYFYDTLSKLDISNLPASTLLQIDDSAKKSSSLFCCFCPTVCDTSNDSDSEGDFNTYFLDEFHQLQIDDENIYLSDQEGSSTFYRNYHNSLSLTGNGEEGNAEIGMLSDGTSIDIDEYISCCDSEDFVQDQILSPIVTDLSKESDITIQRKNISVNPLYPEDDFLLQDDSDLSKNFKDEPETEEEISTANVPFSRYIRVGDLNVYDTDKGSYQKSCNQEEGVEVVLSQPSSDEDATQVTKLDFLELTNKIDLNSQERQTIIDAMNKMAEMGLKLAILDNKDQDDNSYGVSWKEESATGKSVRKILSDNHDSKWHANPESVQLLEEEVLTWSGDMSGDEEHGLAYASKIPLFRGRGIIPSISPLQLAELILDSSKVKLYNKFTNGRDDLCILQDGVDVVGDRFGDGCLKVVESKTNVPLSSKTLSMVNMLHAKPITIHNDELNNAGVDDEESRTNTNGCNGFVIVSRSVYTDEDVIEERGNNITQSVPGSKNELIWGVNILREVPGEPNKTDLTTVSQANSSAVPSFLSHKVCYCF